MSKQKPPKKKKVVVTTQKSTAQSKTTKVRVSPTVSKTKAAASAVPAEEFVIGKQNYIWMGIGVLLIFVGMLLMVGGDMPSPDVWDPNIIYGFRRTVLAPFVILAGLVVEIYAIFKK